MMFVCDDLHGMDRVVLLGSHRKAGDGCESLESCDRLSEICVLHGRCSVALSAVDMIEASYHPWIQVNGRMTFVSGGCRGRLRKSSIEELDHCDLAANVLRCYSRC